MRVRIQTRCWADLIIIIAHVSRKNLNLGRAGSLFGTYLVVLRADSLYNAFPP